MNIYTKVIHVDNCEEVSFYDGSSCTLENILFFVVNHEKNILKNSIPVKTQLSKQKLCKNNKYLKVYLVMNQVRKSN